MDVHSVNQFQTVGMHRRRVKVEGAMEKEVLKKLGKMEEFEHVEESSSWE